MKKTPLSIRNPSGEGGGDAVMTIAGLKGRYGGGTLIDNGVFIRGRVVSTDVEGNFTGRMFIQDHTGGLAVMVGMNGYGEVFKLFGDVEVDCGSLILSRFEGCYQLGLPSGDGHAASINKEEVMIRVTTVDTGEYEDTVMQLADLEVGHVGNYVRITGLEVSAEDAGRTWGDPQGDTDRRFNDQYGNSLVVRTGCDVYFATWLIPDGPLRIGGVLEGYAGDYRVRLNYSHSVIRLE